MSNFPDQSKYTLAFKDQNLEREFVRSYDKSVREPLLLGIIISLLSWYSAISLIYAVIPDQLTWLGIFTFVYIGSYFGFIIYATYYKRFEGYYHLMGALSNAWAGLYTIYFCSFFPDGEHLILPVIIFIIFFGSYLIRLRWLAGFIAALSYIICYQVYLIEYSQLPQGQVLLYSFVSVMVLVFAALAGRTAENNYRIAYIQSKTIQSQNEIIQSEKDLLLKEVHHRVQNNLQVIVSLINLQMMKLHDTYKEEGIQESIKTELEQIQSRVLSMSQVHQRIHQTSNFTKISLKDYVEHLLGSVQSQFPNHKVEVSAAIEDSLIVDIDDAISFGLLLNEMLLGAYRMAIENEQSVIINATQGHDNKIKLSFAKSTAHFSDDHVDSFEYDLIDTLIAQLEGKLNYYNAAGSVYEIEF